MGLPKHLAALNAQKRLQFLDNAEKIGRMYCKGQSQRDIAAELGISRQTVVKSLREIRRIWQERLGDTIADHRAEQLAKIDRIEATAWEAYEISKRPAKEISNEDGEHAKTIRKKKWRSEGNPKFLELATRQIELRIKLLGLDKPEATGASSTPLLEVIVSTRAEAAKMLPYMDFAGEIIEGEVIPAKGDADATDH